VLEETAHNVVLELKTTRQLIYAEIGVFIVVNN
jgi:hypothetical protein